MTASGSPRSPLNRRFLPRWEVDCRVQCRIGRNEHPFEARTVDLNGAGSQLFMRRDLPAFEPLELIFHLPDGEPVRLKAEPVWQQRSVYGYRVGVHFINATLTDHQRLLEYVLRANGRSPSEYWYQGWC